jgi:ectoine hydroxylase-related dioxygenase (phytanoyl-CoA dioxygenase family)
VGNREVRLLVSEELREKFDRQRLLYNQAVWHGDLEDVRPQSKRMVKAWRALDKAAEEAGAARPVPD